MSHHTRKTLPASAAKSKKYRIFRELWSALAIFHSHRRRRAFKERTTWIQRDISRTESPDLQPCYSRDRKSYQAPIRRALFSLPPPRWSSVGTLRYPTRHPL